MKHNTGQRREAKKNESMISSVGKMGKSEKAKNFDEVEQHLLWEGIIDRSRKIGQGRVGG